MPAKNSKMLKLQAEATNCSRRNLELRREISHHKVVCCLSKNMQYCEDVEQYLRDLGCDPDDVDEDEEPATQEPASKQKNAYVAREAKLRQEREANISAAVVETGVMSAADLVPTKYWNIGALSFSLLSQKVLPALEKYSFSAQNVRRVCREGAAVSEESKKDICLHGLEYTTGAAPELKLNGKLRIWEVLLAYLKANCTARNRRGRDRGVSDSYSENGVYAKDVSVQGTKYVVVIAHVTTGTKRRVANGNLPKVRSAADFFLDFNWSEKDAELKSLAKPEDKGYKVSRLFPASCFPSATCPELEAIHGLPQKLAIEDGSPEDPVTPRPAKHTSVPLRASPAGVGGSSASTDTMNSKLETPSKEGQKQPVKVPQRAKRVRQSSTDELLAKPPPKKSVR